MTESNIKSLLTTTTFLANKAATFSVGTGASTRTFLAINNNSNGFNALSDAVIEITGYQGSLTDLAIA
ncbi:MAG: hypothetical protein KME21_29960 [Desmonostoc vinosum HA7617-LM4]|nr:hypothetical protein [Desmonostoc vinosum HA7617-LM4]